MKSKKQQFWLIVLVGIAFVGLSAVMSSATRATGKQKIGQSNNPVRTLDAITIEGEIAVPQVLFITSRDNPRYRDGMGHHFRKSAMGIARSAVLPTRLRVVVRQEQNKEK